MAKVPKKTVVGDVTFHEGVDYATVQRAITRHLKHWRDESERVEAQLRELVRTLQVNAERLPNVPLGDAVAELREHIFPDLFKEYGQDQTAAGEG